jgi:hypothetical protein
MTIGGGDTHLQERGEEWVIPGVLWHHVEGRQELLHRHRLGKPPQQLPSSGPQSAQGPIPEISKWAYSKLPVPDIHPWNMDPSNLHSHFLVRPPHSHTLACPAPNPTCALCAGSCMGRRSSSSMAAYTPPRPRALLAKIYTILKMDPYKWTSEDEPKQAYTAIPVYSHKTAPPAPCGRGLARGGGPPRA